MAYLREIGREGGREAEEEIRMIKKIEVKEWGTQAQTERKSSVFVCVKEREGAK